jgi:hypothetical protein
MEFSLKRPAAITRYGMKNDGGFFHFFWRPDFFSAQYPRKTIMAAPNIK